MSICFNKYLLIFLFLGIISCIQENSGNRRRFGNRDSSSSDENVGQNAGSGGGNQALPGNQSHVEDPDESKGENFIASTEIRHLIDPYDGSYKTKILLPKNYNGFLYVSGLNITSLSSRLVQVRFKFGRDLEPITIPATVARGSGIIPQTDIQVLVLDLRERPFEKIRLLYDLYDYNKYGSTDEALYKIFKTDPNGLEDPVPDDRTQHLYCRGLKLEDDPTFQSSAQDLVCDEKDEKCLYSFAKIIDNGLFDSTNLAGVASSPLIDDGEGDFSITSTDSAVIEKKNQRILNKCLPDNGKIYYTEVNGYRQLTYNKSTGNLANPQDSQVVLTTGQGSDQVGYIFKGPYRTRSNSSWELSSNALFGQYGLWAKSSDGSSDTSKGIYSFLFPRAGKVEIKENIIHYGSSTAFDTSGGTPVVTSQRSLDSLLLPGESNWIDGCSMRALYSNKYNGEGISSCNVTAEIEIVVIDPETNATEILASTKELKLQLIRPSEFDFAGKEVLFQSFKTCLNGRDCGSSQCCFNNKCWSKELVSKCLDESQGDGNLKVGEVCTSHFECESLCCDTSKGRCSVHNSNIDPPVLCSRPPGDRCVAKEWCRKEVVRKCLVVNTGTAVDGSSTCVLRCFNQLTHGSCIDGFCVAPEIPAVPDFNPQNPDCSNSTVAPEVLPSGPSLPTGGGSGSGSVAGQI